MASVWYAFKTQSLPRNYFRILIFASRVCGLELERDESLTFSIFSKSCFFIYVWLYTFVECYELFANDHDLNALTHVVNFCTTHIVGTIKITHLFMNRHKFKLIMKRLHGGIFEPNPMRGGAAEEQLIRKTIKLMEVCFVLFCFLVFLVFLSGFLEALYTYIMKPIEYWHMPFIPISIVDTTRQPMFEIGFFYQSFMVVMVANYIIASDMIRITIMTHLSCQFRILQNALRNAKQRAVAMQKRKRNRHLSLEQCFDSVLNESIEHHLGIIDFANQLEDLIAPLLLLVFLSSVLQLCFMLYQASLVAIGSAHFLMNMFYWVDICTMVLLYCYFGNEVTDEAANVLNAINEMDWIEDTSNSSKKALVLIIAKAQKPLYLTAGKFVPLSLPTFLAVVKGSFSYFMVLKQFNGEREDA